MNGIDFASGRMFKELDNFDRSLRLIADSVSPTISKALVDYLRCAYQ